MQAQAESLFPKLAKASPLTNDQPDPRYVLNYKSYPPYPSRCCPDGIKVPRAFSQGQKRLSLRAREQWLQKMSNPENLVLFLQNLSSNSDNRQSSD